MYISKRSFTAGLLAFVLSALASASLAGSASGTAKVFGEQLLDLHRKVKTLLDRAEQPGRTQEAEALAEEVLATTSLVHRLSEEAMKANLDVLHGGIHSDRSLLLVSQASEALNFTLLALHNFINTGDRLFLSLARDGEVLARSAEKGL
jgi:hypothetical protein